MTFTAQQIAAFLNGEIRGDESAQVSDVSSIEHSEPSTLCFIGEDKYLPLLAQTKASVVLVSRHLHYEGQTPATLIFVDNARGAMAQLLELVAQTINPRRRGVEQPCFIAEGVEIPEDAYIGAFAYIGKGAKIGAGAQIYPQCYVGENVKIGDNTILYAGVKVYYNCVVGNDCILHSGVVVGADGFGFEPDAQGVNKKIPQIGNVIIEDDVELGANTCVDRAMMGSTVVHRNVKVDNLVQIAHNVSVGDSTFLCSQVGIAGSTSIGSHCILTGQVGVAGHIHVTDNCIFGAQTGVAGSIDKPGMYQGSPAIDAKLWRRAIIGFKNLPEMMKIVYKKN